MSELLVTIANASAARNVPSETPLARGHCESSMLMPGSDLRWDPGLSPMARLYCRLLGAPIVGARIRWRRLQRLLPTQAHSILDAGCGRGLIARGLARRYPVASVLAIDSDHEQQARNRTIAERAGLANCRFETADLTDLSGRTRFDLIVSVDNLEHIADDESVLARFHEALTPGGRLLLHVPHYYRRWPIWRRTVNFAVPGHVRPGYHLPEITERVQRAGFDVEAVGFTYGFLENLANNASYAITGARAERQGIYALAFPLLNAVAWLGQWSSPSFGAGVWAIAHQASHKPIGCLRLIAVHE